MSAFRPQTTKTGDLPHLSYVIRKPENLGTEFKSCADPVTGTMSFIEIQKGKGEMNSCEYHKEIGATASCGLRLAKGASRSDLDQVPEVVMGDSWLHGRALG